MSEVMRWKLKGFIPGVEGVSKALFQPWVVPAEDFDRIVSEREALQQRLNAADQRIGNFTDLLRRARAVIEGEGWPDLERDINAALSAGSLIGKSAEMVGITEKGPPLGRTNRGEP